MDNKSVIIIIAAITGSFIAIQGAINSRLALYLSHPLQAGFVSFSVGTVAIAIACLFLKIGLPSFAQISTAPKVLLIGGLLGAVFILMNIYFVPKVGVATVVLSVLMGQVLMSLLVDHFGWFGIPQQIINMKRLLGASLVIVGVLISNHK